jgi:predicted transcriptional regulator
MPALKNPDFSPPENGTVFNPFKVFYGNMIPDPVFNHPGLSWSEKCLFALLLRRSGKNGNCFPSKASLAKDMNLSERSINRMLSNLTKKGFVRTEGTRIKFLWHECYSQAYVSEPIPPEPEKVRNVTETDKNDRSINIEENQEEKQQQQNVAAVSPCDSSDLSSDRGKQPNEVSRLFDLVRDGELTPGTRQAVIRGFDRHGFDYVMRNILYANEKARDNYPAYLAVCLSGDYAADWWHRKQEAENAAKAQAEKNAEIKARTEEAAKAEAEKDAEAKGRLDSLEEVRERLKGISGDEARRLKAEYLKAETSAFMRKRAAVQSFEKLLYNQSFLEFCEGEL